MMNHPAIYGSALLALGVALGAFGAHALSELLSSERLATFETAVRYQMYHGLGLLALGALPRRAWRGAWLLLIGTCLFSGTLYALIAFDISALGMITPLGGVLQIIGWCVVGIALAQTPDPQ